MSLAKVFNGVSLVTGNPLSFVSLVDIPVPLSASVSGEFVKEESKDERERRERNEREWDEFRAKEEEKAVKRHTNVE